MMDLTATNVTGVFEKCLYGGTDDPAQKMFVSGVAHSVEFNQRRLDEHREEITEMLLQLPK